MEIKKAKRREPPSPTPKTHPREYASACLILYTRGRQNVKRGGEPVHIGAILPGVLADVRAAQTRRTFGAIHSGDPQSGRG